MRHILRDDDGDYEFSLGKGDRDSPQGKGARTGAPAGAVGPVRPPFDASAKLPKYCGHTKVCQRFKRNLWEVTTSPEDGRHIPVPSASLTNPDLTAQYEAARPLHRTGTPVRGRPKSSRRNSEAGSDVMTSSTRTASTLYKAAQRTAAPAFPQKQVVPPTTSRRRATAQARSYPSPPSRSYNAVMPLFLLMQLSLLTLAFWECAEELPAIYRVVKSDAGASAGLFKRASRDSSAVHLADIAVVAAKTLPHVAALLVYRFDFSDLARMMYIPYVIAFAAYHVQRRALWNEDGSLAHVTGALGALCAVTALLAVRINVSR